MFATDIISIPLLKAEEVYFRAKKCLAQGQSEGTGPVLDPGVDEF